MSKEKPQLVVEIPSPGADQPAWSRTGIVGLLGFVIGIGWPALAGVKIGPNVPGEGRPEAAASASAAVVAAVPTASAAVTAPTASAAVAAAPSNQETVVVGSGKTIKCADKKNKKVSECDELAFDGIAQKRLEKLDKCPSALGLEGKMNIGLDVIFDKKEVHVVRMKKGSALPSSTVNGILQCAAREFENVALDEVEHKYRRYSLSYSLAFYPPGKSPDDAAEADKEDKGEGGDEDKPASEGEAGGSATVSVNSAVLRSESNAKASSIGRLVRGTKVKIVGREKNWYQVESDGKTGWVHRSTIGQ